MTAYRSFLWKSWGTSQSSSLLQAQKDKLFQKLHLNTAHLQKSQEAFSGAKALDYNFLLHYKSACNILTCMN